MVSPPRNRRRRRFWAQRRRAPSSTLANRAQRRRASRANSFSTPPVIRCRSPPLLFAVETARGHPGRPVTASATLPERPPRLALEIMLLELALDVALPTLGPVPADHRVLAEVVTLDIILDVDAAAFLWMRARLVRRRGRAGPGQAAPGTRFDVGLALAAEASPDPP